MNAKNIQIHRSTCYLFTYSREIFSAILRVPALYQMSFFLLKFPNTNQYNINSFYTSSPTYLQISILFTLSKQDVRYALACRVHCQNVNTDTRKSENSLFQPLKAGLIIANYCDEGSRRVHCTLAYTADL